MFKEVFFGLKRFKKFKQEIYNEFGKSMFPKERSLTDYIRVAETELYYEITYIIEFVIYNNNNVILATSEVEVKRSTTSDKFISLKEKENIAEKIILDALTDVSIKSEKLLKMYMFEYIL